MFTYVIFGEENWNGFIGSKVLCGILQCFKEISVEPLQFFGNNVFYSAQLSACNLCWTFCFVARQLNQFDRNEFYP